MKEQLLEIYSDYKREFLAYYKKIKKAINTTLRKLKKTITNVKNNLLKYENRKKYLTITSIAIVFNLLFINFYVSYGYYHVDASFPLLQAVVGDMSKSQYDYVLLVYVEGTDTNGIGNGEYHIANEIPLMGYNYSGYKCQNNSTLIFDESTKIASVTTEVRDVCSIYFDLTSNSDLSIQIMLEDEVNSNTYSQSKSIPFYGYKYSYYECTNNGKLAYVSNLHKVELESGGQDYCQVYFKKENTDITVNLYVEENINKEDYVSTNTIPVNTLYTLNESRSVCKNNNERVDANITYVDGYINVEIDVNATCDVYLDKYEE